MNADTRINEGIPSTTAVKIVAHLGLTRGVLASVGFGKFHLAAGEVPPYTDVVDKARRDGVERLIAHAQSLGANAIVGVRFDSSDVGGDQGLTEILAYGSGVVVQPQA